MLEVTVYDEDRDRSADFLGKVAIPLLSVSFIHLTHHYVFFLLKEGEGKRKKKGGGGVEIFAAPCLSFLNQGL